MASNTQQSPPSLNPSKKQLTEAEILQGVPSKTFLLRYAMVPHSTCSPSLQRVNKPNFVELQVCS